MAHQSGDVFLRVAEVLLDLLDLLFALLDLLSKFCVFLLDRAGGTEQELEDVLDLFGCQFVEVMHTFLDESG